MGMKLKHLIDTLLSPEIEALPYVDRYGGLVQTMHMVVDNGTENGVKKRYPVACDVTSRDCTNTGIYQDLIPNDSRKSVVYWEEITPLRNKGTTRTNDFYTKKFVGTARLVFWANLSQLGIDNCNDLFFAIPQLEKIITKKGKILVGDYEGFQFWIQSLGEAPKNIETIFGKYDYPKTVQYYLYPNDYFAIDVQFELHQCLQKGGTFPDLPAILCPNGAFDKCNYILNYIGDELKLSCVLPTYDFTEEDTQNALSPQQVTDLTNWLCVPCPPCPPAGVNSSYYFDGIGEGLKGLPNTANDFERTDPFTMSFWFKGDGNFIFPLVSKYTGNRGYLIRVTYLGNISVILGTGTVANGRRIDAITTTGVFDPNIWNYFTFTYDGGLYASGLKVYVNGVSIGFTTSYDGLNLSFTMQNPTIDLEFASNTPSSTYGSGWLYDAKIWNVDLNGTQVLNQYNEDSTDITAGNPPDHVESIINLIDWCKFGKEAGFGRGSNWCDNNSATTITAGYDSLNMERQDRDEINIPT
jgi:hypothetical protein